MSKYSLCALLLLAFGAAAADAPPAPSVPPAGQDARARVLVSALQEATLYSEIAARVARLPVRDGYPFKKGDLLAAFDCSLFQAQMDKAHAALSGAEKTLESNRKLAALKSVGELEIALAEAEVDKARAELRATRVQVDRCTIRAPYNGRVVELKANEHESVPAGRELLTILDDSSFELELIIPSPWLAWLREGQRFELEMDETGRRYRAKITRIGARIDPVSQSIKVKGAIDGPTEGLLAGMSGTALFTPPAR